MNQSTYPVAMFRPEQKDEEVIYWPANPFAVALCSILGKRTMPERNMISVRQHFRVIEPGGRALPYPARRVDLIA